MDNGYFFYQTDSIDLGDDFRKAKAANIPDSPTARARSACPNPQPVPMKEPQPDEAAKNFNFLPFKK
jgi:hypothetical protein